MSCCFGLSVVKLESYVDETQMDSYLKNVNLQLWCSFVILTQNTRVDTKPDFFKCSFSLTEFLFYVIYVKAKIIGVTDIFLNPFAREQWSFDSSKLQQSMDYVQTDSGCKQECPASNINEGIVFKVLRWLSCLSKWGVGPLKRGSYLSVQGQQGWSGEPHWAPLITKKLDSVHNGAHLILMGWWTVYCQLLTLSVLYTQSISQFHQCDKLDNYYFAICTHMGRTVKTSGRLKLEDSLGSPQRSCQ